MTKNKTLSLVLVTFAGLAGCSMIKGKGEDTAGGGGGGEKSLADNMHDAQIFHVGESITTPVECHASGYMKVDAPTGEAFQLDVEILTEGACVDVSYLTSTGGAQNGGQMFGELCESKVLDVTGLDGGSYIQLSETGVCKDASITLALK